jgi:hypothetical protein
MIEQDLKGKWYWGYLHSNGTVQVKRWMGDHDDYTRDCEGNPFVKKVIKPFRADDYLSATRIINMHLKGE